MKFNHIVLLFFLMFFVYVTMIEVRSESVLVKPSVETTPMGIGGDADDICFWIHPDRAEQSLVIGTDKEFGLRVYNLQGEVIQSLPAGELNNVDLRYHFPMTIQDDEMIRSTIMVATNRTSNTLAIFTIDPKTRVISEVSARDVVITQGEVYGCCLYQHKLTGQYYAFVNTKEGNVLQFELFNDGNNKVDAVLVREFQMQSQPEGCVADDFTGQLYIGEEKRGIWKVSANPLSDEEPKLIATTGGTGMLTADVEGLTIYYDSEDTGYLIASSQGSDEYVIYNRQEPHDYVGSFKIVDHKTIDGTQSTDGIDVTAGALGEVFPEGLFVAQDGHNQPGNTTNFKYVSWSEIAKAFDPNLRINPEWNPRRQLWLNGEGQ